MLHHSLIFKNYSFIRLFEKWVLEKPFESSKSRWGHALRHLYRVSLRVAVVQQVAATRNLAIQFAGVLVIIAHVTRLLVLVAPTFIYTIWLFDLRIRPILKLH